MQNQLKKVWLDCGPANDDAMAIVMAVFATDLRGISTVFGNTSIENCTRNTIKLLSSIGRTDIPVFQGQSQSIAQTNMQTVMDVDDGKGLYNCDKLKVSFEPIIEGTLFECMKSRLNDQNFTLILTGAQTNAALLFQEHPEILDQIDEIIFMGGAAGYGNVTPNAEFNIYADPDACQIVLDICQQKKKKVVMVGLDLTHNVLVTDQIQEKIRALQSNFSDWCCEMLMEFEKAYKKQEYSHPPLHDPVAVFYALRPDLFKTIHCSVSVECKSKLCYGRTIVDLKGYLNKENNVYFCQKMDVEQFWNQMLRTLSEASRQSDIE